MISVPARTLAGLLLGVLACAAPGPPAAYQFPSNRDPAAALDCAVARLRLEGFEVERDPETSSALGWRRWDGGADGGAEWWRVEVSVARDEDGRTLVRSVAGSSTRREGPFLEPNLTLQGVVGRLSASCTW